MTSTNPMGGSGAWTSANIDPALALNAISCPSSTFCVAVDQIGQAVTSINPAGGASAWRPPVGIDITADLTGVSCGSPTRCVAVDKAGNAVTTTNANGGAWSVDPIDGSNAITGVSCPSISLCVAVDHVGNAITSTNPAPGGVWTPAAIDPNTTINAVSCASETLCAAVDNSGQVLVSTNPTGGATAWSPMKLDSHFLVAVSCVSGPLCMAVDDVGTTTYSSDPFAGAFGWFGVSIDGSHALNGVSCPSPTECIAVDEAGNAVVGAVNHTLTVTVAGSGSGTVTGPGISCPATCASSYFAGTTVPLTAHAASGSSFSGWTSGGCSGTGACTATLGSDQAVTATFTANPPPGPTLPTGGHHVGKIAVPNTVITQTRTNSHRRSAAFRFHAVGAATGLQCALVRQPAARRHGRRPRPPKPRFTSCRSPKAYKHLRPGRYAFSARAKGPGGTDPTPARRAFTVA